MANWRPLCKAISKGSAGTYITVHYNYKVDASMQGCSKGSVGPFMTVHYNG
jgi:hypothetical protein